MEEEKLNYDQLKEFMDKVKEAMKLSDKKQKEIDTKNQKLYKQTKLLAVDEEKQEIEQLKMNKQEFDEMTVNSLIYSKKQILMLKEELEKKYQDMLLTSIKKQEEVDKKLKSMESKEVSDEILAQLEKSAQNAKNKIKKEVLDYKAKHLTESSTLDEYEKNITEYALKLGVEDKLANVTISAPTSTPTTAPTSAPTTAPTSAPTTVPTSVPTTVPTTAPTSAPTTVPTSAPTTAPTSAPTTAPTSAPTTAPTSAPTTAPTSAPTIAPTTQYKIEIGRKSKIIIDGVKYKLGAKTVKDGSRLTKEEKLEYVKQNDICKKYLESKTEEEQDKIIENLDGTVIYSIVDASIKEKDYDKIDKLDDLMYKYVSGIENANNKKESGFSLIYNMKDLAKIGLIGVLNNSELYEKDKLTIRKYAKIYERYGLAKQVGTYKRGIFSKLMGKLTGEKIIALPTIKDEEIVARTYNDLRDQNKTDKLKDNKFIDDLKTSGFMVNEKGKIYYEKKKIENTLQAQELRELHESQKNQENEYYVDDEDKER